MNLGKLWEVVRDREAWHAASMGSRKVEHDWVTEQQHQLTPKGDNAMNLENISPKENNVINLKIFSQNMVIIWYLQKRTLLNGAVVEGDVSNMAKWDILTHVPTQQQQSGIHPWTKVSLRILQDLALYTKRPWRSLNQSRVGKRHKDLNLSCEPCSGPQTTVLGLLGSGITITCWQSETISHRQVRLYLSLGLLQRSFSTPMEQKNESLDTLERVNETA